MNKFYQLLILSFFSLPALAQQEKFTGIWQGDLDAGMQVLRMIFTISQNDAGQLKVTIQAPQQSSAQVPADTAFSESPGKIALEVKRFKMRFTGNLINDSTLSGSFEQGTAIPLLLKKVNKASVVEKSKRPQTPKAPFPYKSIDVSFPAKDGSFKLSGTLTLPDTIAGKQYPGVILITGSGPQDRDETIFEHKPFAVIADHLTKNGFAVLRIDDRGVGRSGGSHALSTTADFANDTEAALEYLQSNAFIDNNKIGLMGHSEGGMIAPMVASKRKDVKFIVLLAGPGIPCIDLMAEQNVAIFKSNGLNKNSADMYGPFFKKLVGAIVISKDSAEAITNGLTIAENWQAPDSIKTVFNVGTAAGRKTFVAAMVKEVYRPWFRYFLSYDPAPVLKKLSCSILALNGSNDVQVLPASNLAGIKQALQKSKAKSYELKEIPGLNHLFQTCKKCTLNEYATLEESFSPAALEIITKWLLNQVK